MAKILLYTFRTFPFIEELRAVDPEIIVFGKLKVDLERLFKRIEEEKPDLVLGVAIGKRSLMETKAVNIFHKKTIQASGKDYYPLSIHPQLASFFPLSSGYTTSFCNWTMYQIAFYLPKQQDDTTISFIHLAESDLEKLIGLIN